MATLEELKTTLASRLFKRAASPGANADFSGGEIAHMLSDLTGAGVAHQVLISLLQEGYLRQTKTISDEEEMGRYEITTSLIQLNEHTQKNQSTNAQKISFRKFRDSLLIALATEEQKYGPRNYDLKNVADQANLKYSKGWVRKAAYDFRDKSYVRAAFRIADREDDGLNCALTGAGLEAAEEMMEEIGEEFTTPPRSHSAPASDRIVKRSDNEETWLNAIEGTKKLRDALESSNDHGDLSGDEFEQKLSEVRALQILMDSPQVQWDPLNHFAEKTVKYLAVKFADNAIGLAATALLTYLVTLLVGS